MIDMKQLGRSPEEIRQLEAKFQCRAGDIPIIGMIRFYCKAHVVHCCQACTHDAFDRADQIEKARRGL